MVPPKPNKAPFWGVARCSSQTKGLGKEFGAVWARLPDGSPGAARAQAGGPDSAAYPHPYPYPYPYFLIPILMMVLILLIFLILILILTLILILFYLNKERNVN